jgi:hypothetical protein
MSADSGGPAGKVDFRVAYAHWPSDQEFPLTPLEAWYVMKGYAVRPARGISMEEFLELPGMIEFSDGYVMLRQT